MTDNTDTEITSEEQLEKPNARIDMIITIIIGAVTLWYLLKSQQYVGVTSGSYDPGAAFWPRVILVLILTATVVNLINIYRRSDTELIPSRSALSGLREQLKRTAESPERKKFLLTIVLIVGYLLVLMELGFIVSTILYIALQLRILGYDSVWKNALFSLVSTLVIFILFRNFMNISLPFGTGIFRTIGIFVDGLV